MREERAIRLLRRIAVPILLYGLLAMLCPWFFGILWGGRLLEPDAGMWFLSAENFLMLPILWLLYRQDLKGREQYGRGLCQKEGQPHNFGKQDRDCRFGIGDLLLVMLGAVCISRGVNYLLPLTPLPYWFPGYEAASEEIYRCSLMSQIAAGMISAPLLEEVLMRGILYTRLKEFSKRPQTAMLLSGMIFGLFHGNVVQGVYAFVMGVFFALVYEAYDSLFPPVAAHMTANGMSVLAGQLPVYPDWFSFPGAYELLTAGFLLAGLASFRYFWHRV